ncbi:GNAT family N-acetyltransferase [Amycolatopsis minnesotensis]|uniref:GNAT family N-acetyltransferase n=1 Tax=Amycolatopsis minnesotensis TaxID=337894 RepID=UPI0031E3BB9A
MTVPGERVPGETVPGEIALREIADADLDAFFEFQRDPEAVRMAAFTASDPSDRAAFDAHWARIRADPTTTNRTITVGGAVAGNVACFEMDGETEVCFWIDRALWGRGVASAALAQFLREVSARPLRARVADGNTGSAAVLRRCGFVAVGRDSGFANGRGEVVGEEVFALRG